MPLLLLGYLRIQSSGSFIPILAYLNLRHYVPTPRRSSPCEMVAFSVLRQYSLSRRERKLALVPGSLFCTWRKWFCKNARSERRDRRPWKKAQHCTLLLWLSTHVYNYSSPSLFSYLSRHTKTTMTLCVRQRVCSAARVRIFLHKEGLFTLSVSKQRRSNRRSQIDDISMLKH